MFDKSIFNGPASDDLFLLVVAVAAICAILALGAWVADTFLDD